MVFRAALLQLEWFTRVRQAGSTGKPLEHDTSSALPAIPLLDTIHEHGHVHQTQAAPISLRFGVPRTSRYEPSGLVFLEPSGSVFQEPSDSVFSRTSRFGLAEIVSGSPAGRQQVGAARNVNRSRVLYK